jgi:hypothetical protein
MVCGGLKRWRVAVRCGEKLDGCCDKGQKARWLLRVGEVQEWAGKGKNRKEEKTPLTTEKK